MRRRSARPLAVVLVGLLLATGVAQADTLDEIEQQLEDVADEREAIEERIEQAAIEYDRLETRVAELEAERDQLDAELEELRADLDELGERVSFRVRETFKHGQALDPIAVFLSTDDPNAALSKADAVNRVVGGDQARGEDLAATRTSVAAVEDRLAEQASQFESTRQEQQRVTEQLQADFAQLQTLEENLTEEARAERERLEQERIERERREREEREREAREEREREEREAREAAEREAAAQEAAEQEAAQAEAARQAQEEREAEEAQDAADDSEQSGGSDGSDDSSDSGASDGSSDSGSSGGSEGAPPAETSGGMACPLDQPRSFIDSWGHGRSGGRAHRGTDLMGPLGTPVRAITDGVYNIQSSGPSAGLWAILIGDNGDHYWYMHLDSHTVSNGARVSAGDQVGTNGSTGNATAGAEHVHFELHPGGGSAVNPYSLLRSVCG